MLERQHRAERDGETGLKNRVAVINDIRSPIRIPGTIVGVAANIDRAAAVYLRRREHRSAPLTGAPSDLGPRREGAFFEAADDDRRRAVVAVIVCARSVGIGTFGGEPAGRELSLP